MHVECCDIYNKCVVEFFLIVLNELINHQQRSRYVSTFFKIFDPNISRTPQPNIGKLYIFGIVKICTVNIWINIQGVPYSTFLIFIYFFCQQNTDLKIHTKQLQMGCQNIWALRLAHLNLEFRIRTEQTYSTKFILTARN